MQTVLIHLQKSAILFIPTNTNRLCQTIFFSFLFQLSISMDGVGHKAKSSFLASSFFFPFWWGWGWGS